MAKAKDAFRTISEVSEALDTPAHVLRFWESKFNQIKPVKRAGGRRYYRPDDMALLAGIKQLLHEQGMTIKGAQKLLREKGVKHAVALGNDVLDGGNAVDVTPADDAATSEGPTLRVVKETPAPAEADLPPAMAAEDTPDAALAADATEDASDVATEAEVAAMATDPSPETNLLFSAPSANAPSDPAPTANDSAPAPQQDDQDVARDAEPHDAAPEQDAAPTQAPEPDDTPAPEPAAASPVKMPPLAAALSVPTIAEPKDMPARFFGSLKNADHDAVRARAAQIAPLAARLATIRDQMRQS